MINKLINLLGGYTPNEVQQIAIQVAQQTLEQQQTNQPSIVHGFMHHKYNK